MLKETNMTTFLSSGFNELIVLLTYKTKRTKNSLLASQLDSQSAWNLQCIRASCSLTIPVRHHKRGEYICKIIVYSLTFLI